MLSSMRALSAQMRPRMSASASMASNGMLSCQESARTRNSGVPRRDPSSAKKGTWCTLINRQTDSRTSNGTPASHSAMRASIAPLCECPGWPMAPVIGSTTVVLYLATSCSSAARKTASCSARGAAW